MTTEQTPPHSLDGVDEDHQDLEHDEQQESDGDHAHDDSKPNVPVQKRRRVTRACDTCRGKKIKCDGKQPCTHCTVYSYDCTYDQPSNRRRNPAPQYIEALENRLARAEALLKTVMPNVNLDDPNLGNGILPPLVQFPPQMPKRGAHAPEEDKGSMLHSMIEGTGSMDLDTEGRLDFYGTSSGRVFYERISKQMGTYVGDWNQMNGWGDHSKSEILLREKRRAIESPRSVDSPGSIEGAPNTHDLPSKECGKALCECALDDAMALLRFMHQPTFWRMFNRIYDMSVSQWGTEEHRYLPVIYAAMALGTMFAKTEDSKLQIEGYESALDNGFKYFSACSSMMDLTDIRDLPSLQAALLMTYFIQSSAKLSTCYSYVGVCIFGALRMGMHRNCSEKFGPLENEMRKRIFWVIRKMDVFVAGTLGMPILLSDDDIDQEYPAEVDDEFITPQAILPQPEGRTAIIAAANVHSGLLEIWSKILKTIYPVRSQNAGKGVDANPGTTVSYSKIREIEKGLQEWMDGIPAGLRPGAGGNQDMIKLQHLLRMSYAHVQMILYRPFLHYVALQNGKNNIDQRFYACAAACVHVARNSIHIMSEMNRRHLLIGAYWFQMYTTFWAVLVLVFYSVENQGNRSAHEYFNDAIDGKDMLAMMAKRSAAADRCNNILQQVFSKLPERLQRGRQNSSSNSDSRKRHASSHTGVDYEQQSIRNQNNARSVSGAFAVPRTSNIPHHQHSLSGGLKRSSLSNVAFGSGAEQFGRNANAYGSSADQLTPLSNPSPEMPSSPLNMTFGNNMAAGSGFGLGLNPVVQDLASMIFPSNDPFAYPNQPMTTFESQYGSGMDGMNGSFDLTDDATTNMEPSTIGDFMQNMQSSGRTGQPLGPSVPADMMSGDWIRGTRTPGPASVSAVAAPNGGSPGARVQNGPLLNDQGINYDSLFSGGDIGFHNMNGPMWFPDGRLV